MSHDNVFDMLLGMMSVTSVSYDQNNDPFASCHLSEIVAQ
jgi:glucan phosphoethanolaminetransferase (alkaline phosphatase superfamily)